MQKLIIKGKRYLNGKILISGSKNATLPILAACILSNDIKLQNIPLVKDIFTMVELLEFIGLKVKIFKKQNTLEILNNGNKINTLAPYRLVKTMRAGVLVLGSLLTKHKKAKVSLPGGCAIGTRPVDLHLFAIKKMGAKIKIKNGYIIAEAKKGLKGSKIKFPSISVGATENALLAEFNANKCRSTGLVPIAQPPGRETFAFLYFVNNGPRTNTPALIVLTSLYGANVLILLPLLIISKVFCFLTILTLSPINSKSSTIVKISFTNGMF